MLRHVCQGTEGLDVHASANPGRQLERRLRMDLGLAMGMGFGKNPHVRGHEGIGRIAGPLRIAVPCPVFHRRRAKRLGQPFLQQAFPAVCAPALCFAGHGQSNTPGIGPLPAVRLQPPGQRLPPAFPLLVQHLNPLLDDMPEEQAL